MKNFFYCLLLAFVCRNTFLNSSVERLIPIIISKIPHEIPAFTQGLAIDADQLYESTGLYGESSLRQLNISTGKVLQKINLPTDVFGEGLAVFPHQIFQLTWKEKKVLIYGRMPLKLSQTLSYSGEGWGLCRDGKSVWMSNGSPVLVQRDPTTFAILRTLAIKWEGELVNGLNDLECVENELYANVWEKNWIVRIDKQSGDVTGVIDISHLLLPIEKARLKSTDISNGIAFHPIHNTFFLTGKNWPWIFEVKFFPATARH